MAKSSAIAPGGVVSSLQGRAKVLRQGEDAAQALKVGDSVAPGDVILASAQTQIQIQGADGQATAPHDWVVASADGASAKASRPATAAAPAARGDLDDVIGAIERGDEDAATAAGLTGGDGAAMGEGLRVDRVIEVVTPQAFSVAITDDGIAAEVDPTLPREDENDAPVFVDAPDANFDPATGRYSLVTNEDQSVSGRVQAGDPDGDPLTFGKGSDPQNGSVVVNPDGSYTYTPRPDYNGPDSFTVTVSDGRGGTATALVEISVLPSNDPPKVDDPSADPNTGNYNVTTEEDTPVSGQVKATDADGDTLTYSKGSDPASGSVIVRADGTWTYTPNKDFNGSDKFTITVSDGKGGTVTSTINIGVTPVNDPPKVDDPTNPNFDPNTGNYSATTEEDKPVSGQVKATDADGDTLTYAKGSDPASGSVIVRADGTWTYTPNKDFNGSDKFTVTVSDGKGGTVTSTINIGVTPVNDPPKVDDPTNPNFDPNTGNYSATTEEDKPVSGQVKATDADGDTLTYAKGSDPASGSVIVRADGTWTYTPNKDFNGSDKFTVTVSDGKGGTVTSTINVGVTPVNDPPKVDDPTNPSYDPVTGNYSLTTDEDTPVSGQVKATDADGDALTYSKGSDPASGSVIVRADGTWTYTPNKDFNGSDKFTVTVSDGKGGTVTSTINIGVTPVNDPPKVDDPTNPNFDPNTGNYSATTEEDKPVSGQVKATDADGDTLTYAKGSDPASGSVIVRADGTWTYTPNKDFNGSDKFTITVSDGKGGTVTSTINIGVTPVNDPPKVDDPTNPNFDPNTGNYSLTTDEDTPVSGQVKATDADGDTLTYAKGSDPASGSVVVRADGTWTYTPNKDFNGSDKFTVTVSDGKGGTVTSTINIGVTPVNDPPKVDDPTNPNFDPNTGNYSATTEEDKPVSGQVKATDADGDTLTYAKGSDPASGSVIVRADGTWTYTPNKDFNGSDKFTVTVSDGKGGTVTSTINIGVTPVNDPPKVDDPTNPNFDPNTGNYSATTEEDKPVSGQVKATDADGDALTYAKGSDPASGSVIVRADGTWTYTPNKDFNGSDKFTITVSDGKGGTVTSTINIGVTPVNDAPVVLNQTTTLSEEGLLGGHADNQGSSDTTNAREATGQLSFSDTEGQSVSFTLSGPAGLTSGGVAVTWSGQGTASSPLVGSANGKTVLSATVDASGQYKVTLLAPIDHADTTREDTRAIELTVTATDGANRSTSTLTVQVEDDGPLSGAQQIVTQAQAATQDTNLMLIIDTSGSMESRLADQTVNGLKAAIKTLIDRYDNLGDVKVQLVTFADGGKGQSMWLSVQDAKNLIGALTANGGTNYDAALAAARTAFGTPGKISGGVNVSYFITDGEPSRGKALDTTYDEVAWEGFLVQNKVDSYAIGTGTLTADRVANIEPVAFNGITGQEKAAVTLATNAELSTYLLDTVPVIQKGNLALLAGADGMQRIDAFSAVGQTGSSLDASGKVLTLHLKSGGTMQVNLQTGDFTLSQPKNAAAETFNYSVIDKDGDRGTGTLSLSTRNSTPEGTDNTVTLLEDGRHAFSTADFGFRDADAGDSLQGVRIDSLPANGHLSLNGVAVTPGQLISASALNQLVFTPAPNASGSQYAQFTFTVQDSRGTFDASPNTLKLSVTPVNDAPEAFAASSGHNLLGLVDLSVNPLLNLSKTQQVAVNDIDNNLVRIDVRVDALLSLGALLGDRSSLTVSLDPALTQGLLITGSDSRHLVIQSIHPGGTLDITQVNKLLATLHYDPADVLGLSVDLFPNLNITATDAAGASDTACVSSSIIAVGVDVQPVISTVETIVTGAGEHVAQLGTEVFQWTLGDRATSGEHCVDTIHGFDGAARTAGGDVLDLRDLLSGEAGATAGQVDLSKLLSHLDFDTQSQPGSTVIHVSASGEFKADASGNSQSAGCDDQQQIVLANVDIRASLGLDAQASDHQIIAELMQRGKLLVDHS